jgi:hypothetical protein
MDLSTWVRLEIWTTTFSSNLNVSEKGKHNDDIYQDTFMN